jgi:hypothetical chaperone protein
MSICGFDFGTSNSAIGIVNEGRAQLVDFGDDKVIRSAIFVDVEDEALCYGKTGIDDYLDGIPGRLIMSLKSVLGSSLMDEDTYINGAWISYTEVLALLVRHIKERAEQALDAPLRSVVLGRPVRFSDHDDERDRKAEDTLRQIAYSVGFKHVEFQFEPVAAAVSFEADIDTEQLCCVVDLGGGTADFSVIRIGPGRRSRNRAQDVLANHGVHIGGTDLDYHLSLATVMHSLGMGSTLRGSSSTIEMPSHYYHKLSRWHRIFDVYGGASHQALRDLFAISNDLPGLRRLQRVLEQRLGHQLLNQVEVCKQTLSDAPLATIDMSYIEQGLSMQVERAQFIDSIAGQLSQLRAALTETLRLAGVRTHEIDSAFLTGGTGLVPAVRNAMMDVLAPIELIARDPFTAVAHGLTLDAMQRFGR